jgi:hypothetical protein
MKREFSSLSSSTFQEVLNFYQSRMQAVGAQSERRLPELHKI